MVVKYKFAFHATFSMDYPDIIKNHDRATGRDKMVINMKELKEKKINSNIIKDQHNKYRSFRGSL